jgi:hypothetical protein
MFYLVVLCTSIVFYGNTMVADLAHLCILLSLATARQSARRLIVALSSSREQGIYKSHKYLERLQIYKTHRCLKRYVTLQFKYLRLHTSGMF